MRLLLILAFVCVVAARTTTTGGKSPAEEKTFVSIHKHNLGEKQCTFGPAYWCKNLTTSAECHATKHCIQTVWIHQTLPPDLSSVCQTCLEMVKEARDQLLSNETQEEIKEVFDGSCKLLPIKEISKECCKLADEFIPQLVDTLASQMDPQVVCSVAGLCNNERVHQLLQEQDVAIAKFKPSGNTRCDGCHTVVEIVDNKFRKATRDQVLAGFLQVCGRMGSLSDACSNIIITYFNDIYSHLENNLNPTDFCLMAGECSAMFHSHANVEITPLSKTGVVQIDDDLPCDLCKQLVKHLQDILIANTTEAEFHQVLTGICKQTNSFKTECLNIVNEYYPMIYSFMVNELNGTVVCSMIEICPGNTFDQGAPIIPLLPAKTVENLKDALPIVPSNRVQELGSPEMSQLPIERIFPQTLTLIGNRQLCEFCEYFLHFVQNALTDPKTEENIRHVVDEACEKLPGTLNETCVNFVNTYGPAFVAILAQDIDPSLICPKLSLCSSSKLPDVEIFMNKGESGKCPLCLLALENLKELIKNEKTEASIRQALGKLCSNLHDNLKTECEDFVQTYTNEIIEGILADLTPQELCVYFKLCSPKKDDEVKPIAEDFALVYGGQVETNSIPDYTRNGVQGRSSAAAGSCVLCEFVMSQLKQELDNNATEDEIKNVVHGICNYLPKSVKIECNGFVNQYADAVIQLLLQSLDPTQICTELKLCKPQTKITYAKKQSKQSSLGKFHLLNDQLQDLEIVGKKLESSPQCIICKEVLSEIETMLNGSVDEHTIIKVVHEVCHIFPTTHRKQECDEFINQHEEKIIQLLRLSIEPGTICSLCLVCEADMNAVKLDVRKCTICESVVGIAEGVLQNPNVDHSIEHVLEKSCRALPDKYQGLCKSLVDVYGEEIFNVLKNEDSSTICSAIGLCSTSSAYPKTGALIGSEKCTWGPSYWCDNLNNAHECGAVEHCQEKVWSTNPLK